MSSKERHLRMIQAVIKRMAANSFWLKGWSVTLVSALFVVDVKDIEARVIWVALLPALCFWGLDGYYLWQERLPYRRI